MPRDFIRLPIPRRSIAAVLACSAVGCGGDSSQGPSADDWNLVWSDEFDGGAGALPDPANWQFDIGTDWGNGQLEWTTDRSENVSTDGNGNLAITAREEAFNGRAYTSARIKTLDRFEQRYGRFEARIRLPSGQGIWPAFWMLGADFPEVGWPQTGEIDIVEFRGQNPNELLGTVHGPGYAGGNAVGTTFQLPEGRLDTGFRVYAVEWDDDRITWYLDDEAFFTVSPDVLPGEWVFDDPFFMILNVAVGGSFVGSPNETTRFPQTMLVDYVRVYERNR
jgi:beta-glucanase (GH16 family)